MANGYLMLHFCIKTSYQYYGLRENLAYALDMEPWEMLTWLILYFIFWLQCEQVSHAIHP